MKIQQATIEVLDKYARHLKILPETDRYTRFGYMIKDSGIDSFILSVLYNKDHHFLFIAVVDNHIIGFGHLAEDNAGWELAVSVELAHQNKGVGNDLISHMIGWGKLHNVHSVFMHCIHDNKKIQHLARKHGLKIVDRDGADLTALVELPTATIMDHTENFFREQKDIVEQIAVLQRQLLRNLNPLSPKETNDYID